ncbi:helix-turn-helix transcriptional regulator [Tepidibacter aestuarii]|uniref:helix-turn-helix transcriptional regulator n=1 Tax=Tepidibacter aestuarii TaxID=2925782 RepID=UPI0020BD9D6F|nr:YafY family protein [Tepidibacter aestuarii]CAH2213764.1 YafY family transcriptional regulator [Tepidibacter aestuarii]
MQKIERLMAIILALKNKKKMTAKELSEIFEVDIRTIYRDMQALSEINVPVISYPGSEGGYEILDDYFIPPIMFNKDEVFALLLSKKIFDIINIPGYASSANSAFLKIENIVNECFKKDFDDVQKKIVFDIKSNDINIENSYVFDIVKQALKHNFKLKVTYNGNIPKNLEEQIIRPYGIVFEDGIWYIVAFSELSNSKIHLNIESINNISVLDEVFDSPEDFNMTNYYSTCCFKNAYENKNSILIKLRIKKNIYPNIKDYVFFKYGEIREDGDSYIIGVKTTNTDFYVSLAFRFFNGIEILEPLWIREKFKEELKQLNRIYEIKF